MQREGLARLACRVLAWVIGVQGLADAIAASPRLLRLLDGASAARDAAALTIVIWPPLLAAALLGVAAPAIARRVAGPGAMRVLRAPEARGTVGWMLRAAGALVLIGGIDHVAGALGALVDGGPPAAWGADALLVLVAGVATLASAPALAGRLVPHGSAADGAPGPARLIGELAGAAGALGARRLTELAITLKSEAEDVAKRVMRSSIDAMIAAVQQRRYDFDAATSDDGTVTIAFSDMEGFTAMTQRLGDAAAHEVIKHHNRIVRRALRRHGGQEVELQGDGFLLAFPDTAQALRCAVAIQRACADHSAQPGAEPIRVRIGLHRGTPIQEGDRFFGITVILAARIAAQAAGAQVLVSQDVRDAVADLAAFRFDAPREADLKGLSGRHRMHPLRWD